MFQDAFVVLVLLTCHVAVAHKGFESLVSRLEKRRYAAYLGCNTEFRKWEGITYDPIRRVLYTAISSIDSGMEVTSLCASACLASLPLLRMIGIGRGV